MGRYKNLMSRKYREAKRLLKNLQIEDICNLSLSHTFL